MGLHRFMLKIGLIIPTSFSCHHVNYRIEDPSWNSIRPKHKKNKMRWPIWEAFVSIKVMSK